MLGGDGNYRRGTSVIRHFIHLYQCKIVHHPPGKYVASHFTNSVGTIKIGRETTDLGNMRDADMFVHFTNEIHQWGMVISDRYICSKSVYQ